MKRILFILSFLLPLLLHCQSASGGDVNISVEAVLSISVGPNSSQDCQDIEHAYFSLAENAVLSHQDNTSSPNIRSVKSGRRIQSSSKSSTRIIKAGKVLDRQYFFTFQANLLQFTTGIFSSRRYIYTICQMLI